MKTSVSAYGGFLGKPDPVQIRAALIFGPDEGLVRERAGMLVAALVDDPADPFRISQFDATTLADDPARLADEAAAIAMTGGQRVVRIDGAGDRHTKVFEPFLDELPGDGFVVVTASDLAPRSSLRKIFEGCDRALAVACYADNTEARETLVEDVLKKYGLQIDNDAKAYVLANLGNDRMVSRQELEKLALYKGSDPAPITHAEAVACIGDSRAQAFDEAGAAALGGNMSGLINSLERAYDGGDSPVGILRLVARRVQRLHMVASLRDSGASLDTAFRGLRPPAFSREASEMRQMLGRWTTMRLAEAMKIVNEAEEMCKTTGMPAEALCTRALMRLAGAARQPVNEAARR